MGFSDLVETAGADILEHLGQEAVFTPASGPPVTLQVDLSKETALQPGPFDGEVYASTWTVQFLLGDLGRVPVEGETFTVGADVYAVAEVLENDGTWVKCGLVPR